MKFILDIFIDGKKPEVKRYWKYQYVLLIPFIFHTRKKRVERKKSFSEMLTFKNFSDLRPRKTKCLSLLSY